jgi:predicted phage terminase large subunit-like protein
VTAIENHRAFRGALRASLASFTQKSFATVNPGQIFHDNWHLHGIAYHLECCRAGIIKRLIITVPPRSLKSICASVAFPAFILGHDPTQRIICISHSNDLVVRHARDFRSLVESKWYQDVFPGTIAIRNAETEFETTVGGRRFATSIGGTITGLGARYIVIDDPQKSEEALSKSQRERLNDYYATTIYSRLDSKIDGVIILVMQRLHDDDLAGRLLKHGGWHHLNLPAIAEEDQDISIGEDEIYQRKAGTVLHPAREPLQVLQETKRTMGSLHFQAQYQQAPVPEAGNLIRRDWIRYFDLSDLPLGGDCPRIVQTWDTATKGEEVNDQSVCTTWAFVRGNHYLIDLVRQHCGYPALRRLALEQYRKHRPTSVLIEDHGSGTALIQDLKESHGISAIPIRPAQDKVTRFSIASARFEAGEVYFPRDAAFLPTLLDEILRFPQTRFDDQVDSISQYFIWDRGSIGVFDVFWP